MTQAEVALPAALEAALRQWNVHRAQKERRAAAAMLVALEDITDVMVWLHRAPPSAVRTLAVKGVPVAVADEMNRAGVDWKVIAPMIAMGGTLGLRQEDCGLWAIGGVLRYRSGVSGADRYVDRALLTRWRRVAQGHGMTAAATLCSAGFGPEEATQVLARGVNLRTVRVLAGLR